MRELAPSEKLGGQATSKDASATCTAIVISEDITPQKVTDEAASTMTQEAEDEDADQDGSVRGVRLLSHDLLDEIGGPTPTSSAAPSPGPLVPHSSPATGPIPEANLDGASLDKSLGEAEKFKICVDTWNTEAPVFVPGGLVSESPAAPEAANSSSTAANNSGRASTNVNTVAAVSGTQMVASIWTVAPMVQPAPVQWNAMIPAPVAKSAPIPQAPNGDKEVSEASGGQADASIAKADSNDAEAQQLQAQYEWQLRRQTQEIQLMKQRAGKLEKCRAEVKEKWERERNSLIEEMTRYANVLSRYAIPLEEANCEGMNDMMDMSGWDDSSWKGDYTQIINGHSKDLDINSMSLDAKMRKLNGLLVPSDTPLMSCEAAGLPSSEGKDADSVPSGGIANTLQAMFPHATIRTQSSENGEAAEGMDIIVEEDSSKPTKAPRGRDEEKEAPSVGQGCAAVLGDGEVGRIAERLEVTTRSVIDERALRALQGLSENDALEVLHKVDDLVEAQGGRCRNLSSILQSVCRKVERRAAGRADASRDATHTADSVNRDEAPNSSTSMRRGPVEEVRDEADSSRGSGEDNDSVEGDGSRKSRRRARRRRRNRSGDSDCDGQDGEQEEIEDQDPLEVPSRRRRRRGRNDVDFSDHEESNGECEDSRKNGTSSSGAAPRERRQRQSAGKLEEALAAIDIADEEYSKSYSSAAGAGDDYWTVRRVGRAANRSFDFWWNEDHYELKISMGSLDPPFTEVSMEHYVAWLRRRLQSTREEFGHQALRKCCGEVDFSNNGLEDQAVWLLLECMAQYEVHIAYLKLFKNRISQGGVLAICEFIRLNKRAQSLYELHLSHNDIDDDSAHELLHTLHIHKSRYPPRRPSEDGYGASLVPVWVRLDNNRIVDPHGALRALEADGITFCTTRNAHGCGPYKCSKSECPLVQLYLFTDQAPHRRDHSRRWGAVEANGYDGYGGYDHEQEDDDDDAGDSSLATGGGSRRRRGRRSRRAGAVGEASGPKGSDQSIQMQ